MASVLAYRKLRAPREHGRALVDPPWSAVGALLSANIAARERRQVDIGGKTLADLAAVARRQLIRLAIDYSRTYRNVPPERTVGDPPILLAGHQPELFHPGVWFKNFALDALARRHDGVGVNLLVDNDACRQASIRVPGGSVTSPILESIPLDQPTAPMPWEQRSIVDRGVFKAFGGRVARTMAPLVADPLVTELWPLAVARLADTENLGQCLAQSRHQFEERLGLVTLELPISHVCRIEAFWWFVAHLLADAGRVRRVYNEAVAEYRRVHGIRGAAHPVPDLAADGEWIEAPLWVWRDDDPRRRRLFAVRRGDRVELSDRDQWRIELPLSPHGDARRAVERLGTLDALGVKLRPRALVTTMFARSVLGDLFVHGIGGAKYDQLTDVLISRLLSISPPAYLVLSATAHLPIERPAVAAAELARVERELRETHFHPERFVDRAAVGSPADADEIDRRIEEKGAWIASDAAMRDRRGRTIPAARPSGRERHARLEHVNALLRHWAEPRRAQLVARRQQLSSAVRAEAILASREYSFCLFPRKTLCELLLDLLAAGP